MKNKNLILLFLLFCIQQFAQAQNAAKIPKIDRLGVFYAFNPYCETYHLRKQSTFGIQADFSSSRKIDCGTFIFFGRNDLPAEEYDKKIRYNPQAQDIGSSRQYTLKFSGAQVGLGAGLHYNFAVSPSFILSPGINASMAFYMKANADYAVTIVGTDSTKSEYWYEKTGSTTNCDNLNDPLPDIFLLNLTTKFQLVPSPRFNIFIEPYVSLVGVHKVYTFTFSNFGSSVGLAYKLRRS